MATASSRLRARLRVPQTDQRRPIAVRTLGEVLACGPLASPSYALWANCDQCSRGVKLDPQKLAATYGADLEIADLKRRLKCSQCGRHTYSVTLGFDMGPGVI